MKLLTIVGARPQFIKAAMVSRAILRRNAMSGSALITEQILHTGQHYDPDMSEIFFRQLEIPEPSFRLNCGGMTHAEMTGTMLIEIEKILLSELPDALLVYGDTNSTLAGALAAAKLRIPVIHVEAGLRSFNQAMPDELNRILTDHASSLLLYPTRSALLNLQREGLADRACEVGDVMYDAALCFGGLAEQYSGVLGRFNLRSGNFRLATVHRAENTDDPLRLAAIFTALQELASPEFPLILPLHPRTRIRLENAGIASQLRKTPGLLLSEPLSFLDMVKLEKHASCILTDSGGIQKEAAFHCVPCITLRNETEWDETVVSGWNHLTGADTAAILSAVREAKSPATPLQAYGTGDAAEKTVTAILEHFGGTN